MNVIVVATFHPRAGAEDELIDALRETIPAAHAEDGCLLYAIHEAENGTIVMIERWESQVHLSRHAEGHASQRMRERVTPFVQRPAEVISMAPIPVGPAGLGTLA